MELTGEEWRVLSNVAEALRTRFGAREVILYGSAARGQMDEESDIDLLVVLPGLDWQRQKEINAICFDAGLECDRVVSAMRYTVDEMEDGPLGCSPLVLAARREGQVL